MLIKHRWPAPPKMSFVMAEDPILPPALEIANAREAVERLLDEMGLRAFVYTVEAKENGWNLRMGCSISSGWQEIALPVDPAALRAAADDPAARAALREAWQARLSACARRVAESSAHWEHYTHAADMGVRGFGATKAEAFEQAALAMTAVISDPATIEPREQIVVECEAKDEELLLAQWLNSLVFEMATRHMLFSRFAVRIQGTRLNAYAWGEAIDRARHHPAVEVKGATLTTLRVSPRDGGWVAQTVVDV